MPRPSRVPHPAPHPTEAPRHPGTVRHRAHDRRLRLAACALAAVAVVAGCGIVPALPTRPAGSEVPAPAASPAAPVTAPVEPSSTATAPGAPSSTPAAAPITIPPVVGPAARVLPPAVALAARWASPSFILRVPILMYHVIGPGTDAPHELPGLVVPTQRFTAEMQALHDAGWHTITMAQLASDLVAARRPPPRTFVITFDDGHVDGLTVAEPILRQFGYDATFYIVINRLGRPGYLTWPQVGQLAADGMDIGNHTLHHLDMAALPVLGVDREVVGAGRALARMAGYEPVTLAYPSGEENAATVAAVSRLGIDLAVTTRPGALETYADRLTLPRIRVTPSTSPAGLVRELAFLEG